jgi:hypothetical protein
MLERQPPRASKLRANEAVMVGVRCRQLPGDRRQWAS